MSVSPALSDLSRLYQTEFVRSARAVGVLWAVCTLCFAIIQVVVLVQPSWIGTAGGRHQGAGPAPPSGTLGLFEVCVETDWPVPDCRGGLSSLTPLPAFQSVAVLVGVSLWSVWTSVVCLCLFRFCNAATVYKICAWLQLTAGQGAGVSVTPVCLSLTCLPLTGLCVSLCRILSRSRLSAVPRLLGERRDASSVWRHGESPQEVMSSPRSGGDDITLHRK
uniref:LHFPL tetraspan subfamily member 4b n=1 Tax=Myripristis murdjan TaxID=586833 RepID=A0A667ZGA5_9TELE